MRKLLLMALPCLLLLGAAGCKGKSDEPENMKGSVPRPTNWVAPTDYDYSSSMTAIIRLPDALQATQKAEDLLAAFDAAGHCLAFNKEWRRERLVLPLYHGTRKRGG